MANTDIPPLWTAIGGLASACNVKLVLLLAPELILSIIVELRVNGSWLGE